MAPECLAGRPYNVKADVYAFSVSSLHWQRHNFVDGRCSYQRLLVLNSATDSPSPDAVRNDALCVRPSAVAACFLRRGRKREAGHQRKLAESRSLHDEG